MKLLFNDFHAFLIDLKIWVQLRFSEYFRLMRRHMSLTHNRTFNPIGTVSENWVIIQMMKLR